MHADAAVDFICASEGLYALGFRVEGFVCADTRTQTHSCVRVRARKFLYLIQCHLSLHILIFVIERV